MAVTTPPTIDPVPTPPIQRNDRATFSTRVDAFVTWLVNATTQFAALASNVFANATDAASSVSSAANYATQAAGSALAAVAGSNAPAWVSGTTYAVGDVRFSPSTFYTYRRKTAGAGTTDPAGDATNWQVISSTYAVYYMNLREQQPASTVAPRGSSSTFASAATTRALNTVAINNIVGATLSGSNFVLPPGSYQVRARCPAVSPVAGSSMSHKAALYNNTDAAVVIIGSSAQTPMASSGSPGHSDSWVIGAFTTLATKTFSLRHTMDTTAGGLGPNMPSGAGNAVTEVWAEIEIFKVG